MNDIAEIIKQRSTPGILVFNQNTNLIYSNKEASQLISDLPDLFETVCTLCSQMNDADVISEASQGADTQFTVYRNGHTAPFSIRSFVIGELGNNDRRRTIVLVEKVIEKHAVDLTKAGMTFLISKRELEVLTLLCEGLTNRKISERLFISQQTVKDHVRHIMRKVGVHSRSSLIRTLQ
jgi:DNA-binding NarL/FixJ family response regulator